MLNKSERYKHINVSVFFRSMADVSLIAQRAHASCGAWKITKKCRLWAFASNQSPIPRNSSK